MISSDLDQILVHIDGPDRPGVTSTLTQIVSDEGANIIDLGQSVLHGYLTLSAIIGLPPGSDVLKKLLFAVSSLGLKLEVSSWASKSHPAIDLPSPKAVFAESLCITLLGNLSDGKALSKTTQFLASRSINIRDIKTLSPGKNLNGIEFSVDLFADQPVSRDELKELRGQILTLAGELKCDLAVQQDDIFRRHKRMLCMDVDSTFIQIEVIDEMARVAGVYDKVAAITERAMQGKLDFKEALRERVSLLKGLKLSEARKILDKIPLTPGAEKLVSAVKRLGFKVGLVSGGFDFVVDELKRRFHLDFAFSNKLEVDSLGAFTGIVSGSIVDGERKAQVLHDMTQVLSFHPSQTIAVGDGANDRLMLESAGLGIAFKAKPKLQEVADLSINQGSLDSLLLLMGISSKDLDRLKL
jgi:phosphoserine phosphatase